MLRIRVSGMLVAIASIAAVACTSDPGVTADMSKQTDESRSSEDDEDDEDPSEDEGTDDDARDAGRRDAGKADGSMAADAAKDGAASAKTGDAAMAGGDVPCEVAQVVGKHCSRCHGAEPAFGASFSLTTRESFQAAAPSDPSQKLYQVAQERVKSDTRRMPPASSPALSAAELETLSSWLDEGATTSADGCAIEPPKTSGADGGAPSMGGSGGASIAPITYDDPELECHKFTAYTAGNREEPYQVPTSPDLYINFVMKPAWEGTRYIRAFRNIVDNDQVIHHWILYKNGSDSAESVSPGSGAHANVQRLYGWSPGSEDLYFDPDVGMKVEGDVSYLLETHYNNSTGAPASDASGVEVCVTPTPPTHEVTQAWVGTDLILGSTSATGTCTPELSEPVRIIAAHPHMHKKGKRMTVVLNRADGSSEMVFDQPFEFDYQRMYVLDLMVQPGESLTTTCTFSEPATFGTGTNDEMCYFFPISWPAGALSSTSLFGAIHGANTCLN